MLLESKLRQGQAAQSSEAGTEDEGTTRSLGAGYGAGVLLLPVASSLRLRQDVPEWAGPLIMTGGIALRAWAALTLGRFYTRTLRTIDQQSVIRSGPYSVVRHPGYLGTLLMWIGFGLSSRDWFMAVAYGAGMGVLYAKRIRAEEAMLIRTFGTAYLEYMATTPAVIPLIGTAAGARGVERHKR